MANTYQLFSTHFYLSLFQYIPLFDCLPSALYSVMQRALWHSCPTHEAFLNVQKTICHLRCWAFHLADAQSLAWAIFWYTRSTVLCLSLGIKLSWLCQGNDTNQQLAITGVYKWVNPANYSQWDKNIWKDLLPYRVQLNNSHILRHCKCELLLMVFDHHFSISLFKYSYCL